MIATGSAGSGFAFLFILFAALYLLPTIVAVIRHHHQLASIIVIDLLLGWTLIGWVAALAMAVSNTEPRRRLA